MTPLNVTKIDLTEIQTIEIVCLNCKSVITVQLPKQNLMQDVNCVGCNVRLWNHQDSFHTLVVGIVRSLSNWKDAAAKSPFSLNISLQSEAQ